MKYELALSVPCASGSVAQIIVNSLSPEMRERMPKAKIEIISKDSVLKLNITANDVSTLRAAVNSYIRWIETALKVNQLV